MHDYKKEEPLVSKIVEAISPRYVGYDFVRDVLQIYRMIQDHDKEQEQARLNKREAANDRSPIQKTA